MLRSHSVGGRNPLAGARVDIFSTKNREWSHIDLPVARDRLGAAATEHAGGLVCFSGGFGGRVDCVHGPDSMRP